MNRNKTESAEERKRFTLWMNASTDELADKLWREQNCASKSNFIEKAVLFYGGYLTSNRSQDYLPNIVVSTLKSIVKETERRQNSNLFKLAVELSMLVRLFGDIKGFQENDFKRLRANCVEEVKKLNGCIRVENGADKWLE